MRFDKVIIVGMGKIACDCVKYLLTIIDKEYIEILETQENSISLLERICTNEGINYFKALKKEDIQSFFLRSISNQKVLIISANNRFIFTKDILSKEGVEVINFHYSLLPRYRGMNIPTWVIYNGEKETGITWHYVTEEIDQGNIICQKKIAIDEQTTAFEITRKGMILAIEAFKEFIGELLNERIIGTKVCYLSDERLYLNANLPMHGVLDLNLPADDIIKLLHSFDYGRSIVLPKLRVYYKNEWYVVEKYIIKQNDEDSCLVDSKKYNNYIEIYDEKVKIEIFLNLFI